jgi:HEAT repeat protein
MKRLFLVILAIAALEDTNPAKASVAPPTLAVVRGSFDRASLRPWIEAARTAHPSTFAAIAKLRAELPALEAKKRGPLPLLQRELRSLGKEAVPAMVDALDGAPRSLRAALVEAIGWHRSNEARPLLVSLLDDADPLVVRAAAEGVGRYADDQSVRTLAARLDVPAVASGVGTCRRLAMAAALGRKLDSKGAIHALAELASSWAWKTGLPHASEEKAVRQTAAAALVDVFVREPSLRGEASNALMVVDDPGTPALVAAAKPFASSDTVAALDRLLARFASNPAR